MTTARSCGSRCWGWWGWRETLTLRPRLILVAYGPMGSRYARGASSGTGGSPRNFSQFNTVSSPVLSLGAQWTCSAMRSAETVLSCAPSQQQAEFWRQRIAKENSPSPLHSPRPSTGGRLGHRLISPTSGMSPRTSGRAHQSERAPRQPWASSETRSDVRSPRSKFSLVQPQLHSRTYCSPSLTPAGCPQSIDSWACSSAAGLGSIRRTARSVAVACEVCSQAGRQTTATFGRRGEKRARFCGVCALRQPHATLVRITTCSACFAFIAEVSAHTAPVCLLRPTEPRYCKPCAVDRCAVAHMPISVDDFNSSKKRMGS